MAAADHDHVVAMEWVAHHFEFAMRVTVWKRWSVERDFRAKLARFLHLFWQRSTWHAARRWSD
ncbi:hypothetical protein [Thermomonas sp.]|uniref:hypothetical protein n=1 Tax=Thermomonas sp. TaxID=1971895 RepID=UPI00260AACBB|nr:hypothetical protein [Thermomonas sp.]